MTIARAHTTTLATKHKPHTYHCKQASSSRLLANVIIITPPQASDSDFTYERPPRKIPPQPVSVYAKQMALRAAALI
jgi:hypothetical protein